MEDGDQKAGAITNARAGDTGIRLYGTSAATWGAPRVSTDKDPRSTDVVGGNCKKKFAQVKITAAGNLPSLICTSSAASCKKKLPWPLFGRTIKKKRRRLKRVG